MTSPRPWALVVLLVVSMATRAAAQTAAPVWHAGHPVISLGAGWVGADGVGDVTAAARAATAGTSTPPPATLFRTQSELGGAFRAELGVGVAVTRALVVEVVGTAARPTLETRITGDVEGAPNATASEEVEEYTVGARAVYEWARLVVARRARPFLAVGGAYLRQLHEDRALVETGQMWTAGAGLRLFLRGAGPRPQRPLGLTAEFGWSWRTGGIAFVDGARSMPTAQVRLFAAF